ncbi:MAG: PVC-type heme-binding CxxCH protein [Planctomycetota bacterium]|nr:PVC-type heme-binding CxxCH protein [Planctomycetota bacterium]
MAHYILRRVILLCLLGLLHPVPAHADDLPMGVTNTQNESDVSLTPQESLERITVPEGFHVTLFAGEPDLRRPIAFDFDDRGRLWVVENYAHPSWNADNRTDRVVIFEDTDQDGRFDLRKIFWDQGRYLSAIAVGHGGIWLGNTPELTFIADRNGDDVPDSDPVAVLDGFQISSNNVLNNFHWGPDGWLYGAIGLSERSKIGKPGTEDALRVPITRGMWRMHPVSHQFEVLADGMVNPWGADFNEFGDLFTTNTVIAHLWHIVPGMYCQRRATEGDYPYAYRRIQSNADHLHWGGGGWQNSRVTTDQHSVAGGGHAHCGAMIYLGDNWPAEYRGSLFTNNLHGNRVNQDKLIPRHGTYVASHADDFLFGNDPWFRGLSIKYGPSGAVFVSDWHDFGECHDNDGSHRTSGRIYRVEYGRAVPFTENLATKTNVQLATLHQHANEWQVRHARRILFERSIGGADLSRVTKMLNIQFQRSRSTVQRLRCMWTLHLIGDLPEEKLVQQLKDHDEHIRRWAVRLLVDQTQPDDRTIRAMAQMAQDDASPRVRLALASALQKLKMAHRWEILEGLVGHAEDADDQFLPLMIWYAMEPLVAENRAAFLKYGEVSQIPLLNEFVARRAADFPEPQLDDVVAMIARVSSEQTQKHMLTGLLASVDKHGPQPMPAGWATFTAASQSSQNRSVIIQLASLFGDAVAVETLRKQVSDDSQPLAQRILALQGLLKIEEGVSVEELHQLIATKTPLRHEVLKALSIHNQESTARVLLEKYDEFDDDEKRAALEVLVTRLRFAEAMLTAIENGNVRSEDISMFSLQQLYSFQSPDLQQRVLRIWPPDSDSSKRSTEISRLRTLLTESYLGSGDSRAGRVLFNKTCSRCHTLFNEGGRIGPDLTGSGRKQVDYLLSNLLDPSAEIDPAYRLATLFTTDGRLYSGFVIFQDDRSVVVRTQQSDVKIAMTDVESLTTQKKSMMPEGMLGEFSDEQIRDLVLYLKSQIQVPLQGP